MVSLPPLPLIPLLLSLISTPVISLSSALIQTLRRLLFVHSLSNSSKHDKDGWSQQVVFGEGVMFFMPYFC